jgi:predicted GNAT family acetyltransferase
MIHLLDRPVWSALSSRHASLAEGGALARRYPTAIVPFASTVDDGRESLAELAALVRPGETIYMAQADPIALPPELSATVTAAAVQMLAERPIESAADARIRALGSADAAEMVELAVLTKPGPFTLHAMDLGEFFGIRMDGRLAAMAGERMKQNGFTELSGVCVHPDFRGRGLARLLSLFVAGRIAGRGETAYLHVYADNRAAIRLYEQIGFRSRTGMNIAVVCNPVRPLDRAAPG